MFTWLQTYLQKHFRYIFIILLGGVIVAFVMMPGFGGGGGLDRGRSSNIKFFDQELDTLAKREEFMQKAQLSAYLNAGLQQFPEEAIRSYAFNRATAIHLANRHSIPAPGKEELRDFVQSFPIFQDPEGSFSAVQYNSFIDMMDASGGENRKNIAVVLEEEWRIKKLQEAISGPGFVMEAEVLDFMKAEQTKWSISVAEYDLNSYKPEIESSEAALQDFYTENNFLYATPERRTIAFTTFDASGYLSEIQATDDQLLEFYESNLSKYQRPLPDTEEEKDRGTEDIPFEEAKEKVASDYKNAQASVLAQNAAHELVVEIARNEIAFDSDAFAAALKEHGKEIETTAPFANNETPVGADWSPQATAAAFRLTPSRYYSDPLVEGDSALVLFLKDQIESEIPPYDEVADKVSSDYAKEETRRLQVTHGEELQAMLKQDSEDEFNRVAEENDMTVTTFSDFTLVEPAENLDPSIAYSIANYTVGQVSPMTLRGTTGIFVYISSKEVPEISSDDKDYSERFEQLKEVYKQSSLQQYIGELTQRERSRIGLAPSNS